jgi:chromosome segregation ATPase
LPEGADSSHQGWADSRSERQRARNEAKRQEVQSELEKVARKFDSARQDRDRGLSELSRLSTIMSALEEEKRQSGADPERQAAIDRRLQEATGQYISKERDVANRASAMRTFDETRTSLQNKLDKLRWT